MVLTLEETLVLLCEECAEVIQAATKCLRFGYRHDEPGYGANNEVLASEIGDMLGVIDNLPLSFLSMASNRSTKMARAESAKKRRKVNIEPPSFTMSPGKTPDPPARDWLKTEESKEGNNTPAGAGDARPATCAAVAEAEREACARLVEGLEVWPVKAELARAFVATTIRLGRPINIIEGL